MSFWIFKNMDPIFMKKFKYPPNIASNTWPYYKCFWQDVKHQDLELWFMLVITYYSHIIIIIITIMSTIWLQLPCG